MLTYWGFLTSPHKISSVSSKHIYLKLRGRTNTRVEAKVSEVCGWTKAVFWPALIILKFKKNKQKKKIQAEKKQWQGYTGVNVLKYDVIL